MKKMTAVVTGGTGGIGTAICQHLSADYQVIACYYKHGRHEAAQQWQAEQKKAGFDIDIMYGDISLFADCEKLTAHLMEKYGHLDILVNNAAVTNDTTLKKMTPEQWQTVIDANLTSVFNMTRNILPHMLQNNYGRIISISSINGRKGQLGQCNYAASKAALFGFTKSLAKEVASKGITVNTISPGYIDTPMLAKVPPDVLQSIIAEIPVGRLGLPADVANGVAFLADQKNSFITGTNLDINGGQYM